MMDKTTTHVRIICIQIYDNVVDQTSDIPMRHGEYLRV